MAVSVGCGISRRIHRFSMAPAATDLITLPGMAARKTLLASVEHITQAIPVLRGQRVILDSDLAAIYGVTTGRLNEAVKRNAGRFPEDFIFRLSVPEHAALISQIAISNPRRGGRRKLPWAFTEHGAIQAANVLNSPRAVAMGVYVVRAFVKLRELLITNRVLARKLDELETRLDKKLTEHDEAIAAILAAIRELMRPPEPQRRGIGFTADTPKGLRRRDPVSRRRTSSPRNPRCPAR